MFSAFLSANADRGGAPEGPPWPGPCVSMSGARPRCALFCAALASLAASPFLRASSISCRGQCFLCYDRSIRKICVVLGTY